MRQPSPCTIRIPLPMSASSPPGSDPTPQSAAGIDAAAPGAEPAATGPSDAAVGFGSTAARSADPASVIEVDAAAALSPPRKGPLSFLSGALTSGLLAWLCLGLSQKVVGYYAGHPPLYSAPIAQSIATALKTLIVGMCFLATFSFAFIGLGLALTFLRSLMPKRDTREAS
jgi:hypothetical protein